MSSNYTLNFPGQIIFGDGSISTLSKAVVAPQRVLLVAGSHAVTNGTCDRLLEYLTGNEVCNETGPGAEPTLEDVDRLIIAGRDFAADAVIAVGGGSVLDAAKAAAAIIPAGGLCADYFSGDKKINSKGLLFVALPTTSGTGAEITPNSVLIDPVTDVKKSLRHQTMFADFAIVDPELTWSCPVGLSAASGMDALTQAIESYISRGANTVSKALAKRAVELIYPALPKVCSNPMDRVARSDMAEGSMITAMAFSQSSLGAVHGIGHPIGSSLHVPHGLCCAILLPRVLKWNSSVSQAELNELACVIGSSDLIGSIEKLCSELNISKGFGEYGLSEDHFDFIVKNCRSGSMRSNPREMTDTEVIAFLRQLI